MKMENAFTEKPLQTWFGALHHVQRLPPDPVPNYKGATSFCKTSLQTGLQKDDLKQGGAEAPRAGGDTSHPDSAEGHLSPGFAEIITARHSLFPISL